MTELECAVEALITAIRNTDEYRKYEQQKEKVHRFPELKAQIDEFRVRNYRMQQNTSGDEDLFYKIEEFEQEYENFREDPLVSDFLAAELDFCRMMQAVNIEVTAALDFD